MNSAIHMTLTPIHEAIEHARSMPNADVQLGVMVAHLKHRDEAIEDLHETIAELTRRLETLQAWSTPAVTFVPRDSATPASVQEFVNTAWDRVPVGGGA